jgi:FPC/CPF motif-containing protein YcgG
MINNPDHSVIDTYRNYLNAKEFPCVAARAAISRQQIKCMVADHMACSKDDGAILQFLNDFVDDYRRSNNMFHSASIIFKGPQSITEEMFDALLWQRLQSLADLDAQFYKHDERVDHDPSSAHFSFSIKEEAFFIIGLHPANSRPARRFTHPVLAFNPHSQFEHLRETNNYEKMKHIVRKRDISFSGSVNPMLKDFGTASEVYQYSGRVYDDNWHCPLNLNYESIGDNPTS